MLPPPFRTPGNIGTGVPGILSGAERRFGWTGTGAGRWVAAGTFVPAGSRKEVLPPPFRTPRGTAPGTGVPGARDCWGDGVRPSPQTPLTGAGGTSSRLVRGWGVVRLGGDRCWAAGGGGKVPSRRECCQVAEGRRQQTRPPKAAQAPALREAVSGRGEATVGDRCKGLPAPCARATRRGHCARKGRWSVPTGQRRAVGRGVVCPLRARRRWKGGYGEMVGGVVGRGAPLARGIGAVRRERSEVG